MEEYPVDIIFGWCDSSDPVFAARRAKALGREVAPRTDSEKLRDAAHDELKYAIRSVERNAPWIRSIIVAVDDCQTVPDWVTEGHPKVRIVRPREFIPEEYLPSFNSLVIEFYLHRIPGLSEHYLYGNDDNFLYQPIELSDCFADDGFPYVRFGGGIFRSKGSIYTQIFDNACALLRTRFPDRGALAKAMRHGSHHNIDAYRRSDVEAFSRDFAKEIAEHSQYRFRDGRQLDHAMILAYALAIGHAHYRAAFSKIARKLSHTFLRPLLGDWCESGIIQTNTDFAAEMKRLGHPKFLCINDAFGTTEEQYRAMKKFMETNLV